MSDNALRSDLKKAKNLGAAGHGTTHWWYQRLTAILLVPLTIWAIYFAINIYNINMAQLHNMLQSPLNFTCLGLFIISSFYHSVLGMQVIIEDYISCIKFRFIFLILLKIFSIITVAAAIIALCFFVFS